MIESSCREMTHDELKEEHKKKSVKLGNIQKIINEENNIVTDGYHTFDELYYHRAVLFSIICNQNKDKSWKSKLHFDGTMYDSYFIVGINTKLGQYTYHYHMKHDYLFEDISIFEKAPEYDGHKSKDIDRLLSLLNDK